jgi:hypothetical protein
MRDSRRARGLGLVAVVLVAMVGQAEAQTPNECPYLGCPARRNIKSTCSIRSGGYDHDRPYRAFFSSLLVLLCHTMT